MILYLLALLFLPLQASASLPIPEIQTNTNQDVIAKMDALISATEASVERQKALRALLIQYKDKEKQAINNPDDTDNLMQLVELAKQVKESIDANFLQDYFPQQFLQELNKLASIGLKKNIPPAK